MAEQEVQIVVELGWVDAGPPGWLLMHRCIRRSTGEFHEYWRADGVTALDLVTLRDDAARSSKWCAVLEGVRVDEIVIAVEPGPIVLRLRDVGSLESDAHEQAHATRTVALDEVTVRFTAREGRLTPCDATLRTADNGVAGPALRDALDTMDLDTREAGRDRPRRDDFSRDERLPAPRIVLRDVRGAQIGDYNVQINRFVARNENVLLNFDRVLKRVDVCTAIQRLQRDPSDSVRRKDLERVLRDGGWSFFSKRQVLEARSEGRRDLLRGLVTFESRGLQIGNHGEQRNTFYYTVRSPDATGLVRGDRAVARALTFYLCPRADSDGDVNMFRGVLEQSISRLPIRWDGDRLQQFRAPRPGETLRVSRVAAVSIGESREVRSTDEVDIRVADWTVRRPFPFGRLGRPTGRDIEDPPETKRTRDAEDPDDELSRGNRLDRHSDRGPDSDFGRGTR